MGYYQPKQRLNVDQSPLPFATECKKTYEIPEKDKKVWVNQPTSDTGKRFCSLSICFRPVGEQPRISVIFRGQGKRISKIENESWNKDIDIYFQSNAWADTDFCVKWAKGTLKLAVEGTDRFVLFVDILEGQKAE